MIKNLEARYGTTIIVHVIYIFSEAGLANNFVCQHIRYSSIALSRGNRSLNFLSCLINYVCRDIKAFGIPHV